MLRASWLYNGNVEYNWGFYESSLCTNDETIAGPVLPSFSALPALYSSPRCATLTPNKPSINSINDHDPRE